jgi:hypothetical protein
MTSRLHLFFRGSVQAGAISSIPGAGRSRPEPGSRHRRKSEAISEKAIGDIAKLGKAMSSAMAGLGVSLGPRTPETLIEVVGRLPGVVRELELLTARRVVHQFLTMFESHYQVLHRTALSGSWAPGISDEQCDELEEDCAAFARNIADAALKDLKLLPQDESEAPGLVGSPN